MSKIKVIEISLNVLIAVPKPHMLLTENKDERSFIYKFFAAELWILLKKHFLWVYDSNSLHGLGKVSKRHSLGAK